MSINGTANFLEDVNLQDAIQTSFGGTKDQLPLEDKKQPSQRVSDWRWL